MKWLFSALLVAITFDINADNNGASIKFAILSPAIAISVCLKKIKDTQPNKLAHKNHKTHAIQI